MRHAAARPAVVLAVSLVALSIRPAGAASPSDDVAIPNWQAPPYWMAPSAEPRGDGAAEAAGRTAEGRRALTGGTTALPFVALFPCRLVDTRGNAPLTGGFLPAATLRSYTLTGVCNVPANAKAVSLNATVVHPTGPGFLTLYPEGGAFPPVSTLNYLGNDVVVNAAVVPLSAAGGISMALGVSGGDVILDTNGYYTDAADVASVNGLTGDVTLSAGANVTLTPSGNSLTIASSAGSGPPTGAAGGGLSGTYPNPGIAAGAVGTSQLASAAVTDAKVASGISYAKLSGAPSSLPPSGAAGGSLSGAYPNPGIAASSVGTSQLGDGSVTDAKVASVSFGKVTGVPGYVLKAGDTMTGNLSLAWANLDLGFSASTATTGSIVKNGVPFLHDSGPNNIFVGYDTGNFNVTGNDNSAFGQYALHSLTGGTRNTAVGSSALYTNLVGSNNTAVGFAALSNLWGSNNTAVGYQALAYADNGTENTALGVNAGARYGSSTGYTGSAVTLAYLTNGNYNTFVGFGTGTTSAHVGNCTAVGIDAYCDGDNQVRLGNFFVTSIGGKVAWSTLSDARAKDDVRELAFGLDFVLRLRPVSYRLKGGNGRTDMGFLAQDVEGLLGTEFNVLTVGGDADRTLSLRYTDLIAPLVKAVQEQQETIRNDRRTIEELAARLARLEAQLGEGRR